MVAGRSPDWCTQTCIICDLPELVYFVVLLIEERYEYLINGAAQAEILQYMSVDHSAEEYNEVVQILISCF